ncbi:MAG: YwmB family TATA-box binding protein [Priestia megaterium]
MTKEKLNLQFGLRTEGLGDRTNFVVGTPIRTLEY